MAGKDSLTNRLRLFLQGDSTAVDSVVREIMPEIYRVAARHVNNERYIAPLTRTELINEFWVRYLKQGGFQINDRAHFFVLVSNVMRQVLVDMARKRLAARRGDGAVPLSLDESGAMSQSSVDDDAQIVEIGILMDRLQESDPDAAASVDMHYFAGFTFEEAAEKTGLTVKQVRRRWDRGRKFLGRALG